MVKKEEDTNLHQTQQGHLPPPQQSSKKKNRRRGRTTSSSIDKNGLNGTVMQPPPGKSSAVNQPSSSSSQSSVMKMNDKKDSDVTVVLPPHTTLLIPIVEENEYWYNGFGPVTPERNATITISNKVKVASEKDSMTTQLSKSQTQTQPNPLQIILKYRSMADQIYRNEILLFNHPKKNNSSNNNDSGNATTNNAAADTSFLEHTIARGTLKDKIAAMSVLVSTYPIHKLYILDSLLSMVGCHPTNTNNSNSNTHPNYHKNSTTTNSRVVQMAAEALEDLFINTLLPKDRKLVTLQQRPLLLYENSSNDDKNTNSAKDDTKNGKNKMKKNSKKKLNIATTKRTLSPRILLLWRFEEMIKERYDMFLRHYIARTLSNDIPTSISSSNNGSSNTKASSTSSSSSNAINLDGPKIAALRTGAALLRTVPEGETYLLPLLVNKLGDPKATICNVTAHELRKILHLHPSMVHIVAREVQQLVHRPHLSINAIYNCITFLNQLKLVRSSTNYNHDDPYALLAMSLMNTYFRLFDIAIQRPSTHQSPSSNSKGGTIKKETNDVHQSRLLSALLTGVNRAHPYLPPPLKTANNNAKNPTNVSSILDEHIDALYRVVHTAPPAARTQSLLLLYHIAVGNHNPHTDKSENGIVTDTTRQDRFYRALYATLADPIIVGTGKHVTMYFNLLYKAMKSDHSETNAVRLIAFTKRLWSTALHCSASVLAAVLFLIDTIAHDHHPFLHTCYRTILSERDALRVLDPTKREPCGALVVLNDASRMKKENNDSSGNSTLADVEILAPGWELALTKHHYHPSVKKFAEMFGSDMTGIGSNYTGDPLRDFALAPFLDKFAYRNPKSVEPRTKGGAATNGLDDDEATATVMEKFSHSVGARRQRQADHVNQPLNDPSFIESSVVNEDEVFFHKFFVERAKRDAMKGIVRNKNQNNDTNVDDDEAEIAALDRAESRNADQSQVPLDLDDYDTWDQWETDDEEEDFVDSLAQQIIEDSMEGNAIDDLDDEDPDTEGWDDLHDDGVPDEANDIDGDDEVDGSENDDDHDEAFADDNDVDIDDTDAFMDDDDDDSDTSQDGVIFEDADETFDDEISDDDEKDAAILLAEAGDTSDVDDLEDSDDDENDVDDDGDDDDYYTGIIDDEDEGEDDDAPLLLKVPLPGHDSSQGVFAAADEYAEIVEKSWNAQKRHYTSWNDDNNQDDEGEENENTGTVPVSSQPTMKQGSKKKRRKRTQEK